MLGLVGLDVKEFGTAIKRALRKPKRSLVLFLGAGCSWPTIPLARDIVDDLRGLYGLRPLRSHEQLYYQHNVEKRMETVDDRYEYFVGLCKDKAPAKPYVELAKLVAKMRADGHTVVIVTTNFDPLFERALGKEMVDTEVCDLGGVRSDLDSLHKMLSHDSESLHVVKLLGSTRGEGKVYFDLENGQEVGRALAKVLPSTARVVVLGYGGAEWGVAEMFKPLFGDEALDPKHLFWCTPPGQGPPHEDPRNVVFSIVKDRHPKWVKDTCFSSAVVQLGGDVVELEVDIAKANAAAPAAAAEAGPGTPSEHGSPPGQASKRRRVNVALPVAAPGEVTAIDLNAFQHEAEATLENKFQIVFFLGAGCSAPAVPTVQDIIDKLSRGVDPALSPYLETPYETIVMTLHKEEGERQAYFSKLCADKPPTEALKKLAQVIKNVWFHGKKKQEGQLPLFLTTNFDPLLEQALADVGLNPVVHDMAVDVAAAMDRLHSTLSTAADQRRPAVIKLLGQCGDGSKAGTVKFDLDKGWDVAQRMKAVLSENVRVIVVGYRGAEAGVAQFFKELIGKHGKHGLMDPQNLYWCTRPGSTAPFRNKDNVVFREFLKKPMKWVQGADFESVVDALDRRPHAAQKPVRVDMTMRHHGNRREAAVERGAAAAAPPVDTSTREDALDRNKQAGGTSTRATKKLRLDASNDPVSTPDQTPEERILCGVRLDWTTPLHGELLGRMYSTVARKELGVRSTITKYPKNCGAMLTIGGGEDEGSIDLRVAQGAERERPGYSISLKATSTSRSIGGLRVLANELVRLYVEAFDDKDDVSVEILWPSQLKVMDDLIRVNGTDINFIDWIIQAEKGADNLSAAGDTAYALLGQTGTIFGYALDVGRGVVPALPLPPVAGPTASPAQVEGVEARHSTCPSTRKSAFDAASPTIAWNGVDVFRWIGGDKMPPVLQYCIAPCGNAETHDDLKELMADAVKLWTDVANVAFVETEAAGLSTTFTVQLCEGTCNKYANAFFPEDYRTNPDSGKSLNTLDVFKELFTLERSHQVALIAHELGHILGLAHNGAVRELGQGSPPGVVLAPREVVGREPMSIMSAAIGSTPPDGTPALHFEDKLGVVLMYGTRAGGLSKTKVETAKISAESLEVLTFGANGPVRPGALAVDADRLTV